MCEVRLVELLGAYGIIILILSSSAPVTGQSSEEGARRSTSSLCLSAWTNIRIALTLLHCIKPIIHHQGLFSVTVNVLFTRLKNTANGVSSTAQAADCKHVFLSHPYKRINEKDCC